MERLTAMGLEISNSVTLRGVVSFANFDDPWANLLGVYQELAPASEAPGARGGPSFALPYAYEAVVPHRANHALIEQT